VLPEDAAPRLQLLSSQLLRNLQLRNTAHAAEEGSIKGTALQALLDSVLPNPPRRRVSGSSVLAASYAIGASLVNGFGASLGISRSPATPQDVTKPEEIWEPLRMSANEAGSAMSDSDSKLFKALLEPPKPPSHALAGSGLPDIANTTTVLYNYLIKRCACGNRWQPACAFCC
jgi:hypothetical protein